MKRSAIIIFSLICMLTVQSCKKKEDPVDQKAPAGNVLRFSDAVPFTFDILKEEAEVSLGLDVVFVEDSVKTEKSGTSLKSIPMYCMLMSDDNTLIGDKKFEVKIQDKKGWLGEQGGKSERTVKVSPDPLKPVVLKPGRYHFKVYANTASEENITGISRIQFHQKTTPPAKATKH